MEEKELFKYGDRELNVNSLLSNITSNYQSYLDYYSTSISDVNSFTEKLNYIKEGIKRGNITTDGSGIYYDTNNKLLKDDIVMSNALHYVDIIAKELSKKTQAAVKQQTIKQEKRQGIEKQEVRSDGTKAKEKPSIVKQDFTPDADWSVAKAFTHSFNNNGQIPYEVLQQLITVGEDGKEVYTDLHAQLSKNFDKVSKQLQAFNNTESYITNINAFKKALQDGNLSPHDRLLGMELGFRNSELDKLNNLIQYKIQPAVEEVVQEPQPEQESKVPELKQDPLESNAGFQMRVNKLKSADDYYTKLMNLVNFDQFKPSEKLKNDSEEAFKNYLKYYIHMWVVNQKDFPNLIKKEYYPAGIGGTGTAILPLHEITAESLKYLDPKLYNQLGLKYFSNYYASNMYKHFKELVEKQNKEQVQTNKEGGIIKAQGGVKVPIQLDFNSLDYNSINDLTDFTSYDAKQMSEVLNSIPAAQHTFSGEASDAVQLKSKATADFITRLKGSGDIQTGNGILFYDNTSNSWKYRDQVSRLSDTDEVVEATDSEEPVNNDDPNQEHGNAKPIDVAQLKLKQLNLKRDKDINPDGLLNSMVGYVVNEVVNAKKQEIQKTLPLYQEIYDPEKAFKTAYTYDLESAKNKIMAEATGIKPITSDASVYYAARNEAIKNAREYTTKLDAHINDVIHQTASENQDIAFSNAQARVNKANTNAKHRHEWEVEQKQGEIDRIDASNQSFQNLSKEIKHSIVTRSRNKQKQRDAYMQKHIIDSIKISPSNYFDGWTKHYDEIWYKGQNGQLTTTEEQIKFQQLQAVVQQAISSIMAQYQDINYDGRDTLYVPEGLKKPYKPSVSVDAKGGKIDKRRINNFVNKLK